MAERRTPIVDVTDPVAHPAAAAWRSLGGRRNDPVGVQILKEIDKTRAYRLSGCGPDGGNIVATRRAAAITRLETTIYEKALSRARVSRLRLHGVVDEADGTSWMFLDDAGEVRADLRRYDDRVLAGRWLGELHLDMAEQPRPDGLPDRDLDDARRTLASSRATLMSTIDRTDIDDQGRRSLEDLVGLLDAIGDGWHRVVGVVGELPATLFHADFVGKNMRLRDDGETRTLDVFDWDVAGWGPPVRDLAAVDVGAYMEVAGVLWGVRARDLDRLSDVARLLRLIAAIDWEMPGLRLSWLPRVVARLSTHTARLRSTLVTVGLEASNIRRAEASEAADGWLDRSALAQGLRQMDQYGDQRIVDVIEATPDVYRSTSPIATVRCAFDDGIERRVFVKRDVPGLHAGGPFWAGGPYEARVYRDILAARDLGTPAFYGSWSDLASGDTYLAVEHVDGWRLGRSDAPWLVEAARWLGRLHRDLTPIARRHPGIRAYDRAFYVGLSRRAMAAIGAAPETTWVTPLLARFDDVMIPRLVRAAREFIHGEPYPENLLVSAGRIRAVDWQSAAIGPAAIDVACLTEGPWPSEIVAAAEAAYMAERGPDDPRMTMFERELEAARLYWSVRWLGVDATVASPQPVRLASLRRSAERLGLVPATDQ